MTNWKTIIDTVGVSTVRGFATNIVSASALEQAARHSEAAGPVRTLLRRTGKTAGARRAAREALRRRGELA